MAIGEAGQIVTNSATAEAPITVTLEEPLTDPVIVLTATSVGGHPFTLRVIDETFDANGDTTSFTFIIEEWRYLDGAHPAVETVNFLAIEEGVHTLPDGRTIEAGQTMANHTTSSAAFEGDFEAPPVVLTSVMSLNGGHTVDSDPFNISETGFDLSLQEEEGGDTYHTMETVGFIAIQPGGDSKSGTAYKHDNITDAVSQIGLGDSFDAAIVLADEQTRNDHDAARIAIDGQTNATVDIFIEEEQSADNETSHGNETIGVAAFESGLIPCFSGEARIGTKDGVIPAQDLQPGTEILTSAGCTAPVRLVLSRKLSQKDLEKFPKLRPIIVSAGALGQGLPRNDLRVSPQHRILVSSPIAKRMFGTSEVLVAATKLTTLPGFHVDTEATSVTYVHLVFDEHQIIFAEGAPTESLLSGPQALKSLPPESREEILMLFPEVGLPEHEVMPARKIPSPRNQRRLVNRIAKNDKTPIDQSENPPRVIWLKA